MIPSFLANKIEQNKQLAKFNSPCKVWFEVDFLEFDAYIDVA